MCEQWHLCIDLITEMPWPRLLPLCRKGSSSCVLWGLCPHWIRPLGHGACFLKSDQGPYIQCSCSQDAGEPRAFWRLCHVVGYVIILYLKYLKVTTIDSETRSSQLSTSAVYNDWPWMGRTVSSWRRRRRRPHLGGSFLTLGATRAMKES